ncbi:NAD(P)-dependent oxidoreductase [Cereibacter changlensis]|uniref:NAD(P)-dependent oxidoreductase n=1 Tax=Cereibacter changlensis TaxID=402884 RepID=UPI004034F5D7
MASLTEGLGEADLVSLHTPLRPETRHMIDARAFAAMRSGAILVNMARAGLVDEAALLEAVASGHLGGAGLDVCSPGAPSGPLAGHGNVVFTPHLGGTTEQALRRVAVEAARHVIEALAGRLPDTAINPDVWRTETRSPASAETKVGRTCA